ncbi:peroxidase 12-like [Iris pallida]|uniref:Peroxidase n=1 Tax=Iris pallida TaxID=29817 RepID=A0AAX6FV82_IRIPA|nr:peroxidase 12-like [Iris pallida]
MASSSSSLILFLLGSLALLSSLSEAKSTIPVSNDLSYTFYKSKCPKLESIVKSHLQKAFKSDIGLAAGLLRLHFHDCFVQARMRCFGAARRICKRAERAGCAAEPHAATGGVQSDRRPPAAHRSGLRAGGLVRRRRSTGRPRLCRHVWRTKLQGPPRPPRRTYIRHPQRHPRQPPGPVQQRRHHPQGPREDQPQRRGPGGTLRRPHHRHQPLHLLHRPPLPETGPHDEQVLRQQPQGHLPHEHDRQHHRARHPLPEQVRQQVLRRPPEPPGPVHVGPGLALRPEDQAVRQQLRAEPDAVLREVRGLDGEDGADRRADWQQRGDSGELFGPQRWQEVVLLVRGGGDRGGGGECCGFLVIYRTRTL